MPNFCAICRQSSLESSFNRRRSLSKRPCRGAALTDWMMIGQRVEKRSASLTSLYFCCTSSSPNYQTLCANTVQIDGRAVLPEACIKLVPTWPTAVPFSKTTANSLTRDAIQGTKAQNIPAQKTSIRISGQPTNDSPTISPALISNYLRIGPEMFARAERNRNHVVPARAPTTSIRASRVAPAEKSSKRCASTATAPSFSSTPPLPTSHVVLGNSAQLLVPPYIQRTILFPKPILSRSVGSGDGGGTRRLALLAGGQVCRGL
ncbi:hypothetical protein HDK64DRAFT_17584 [Phyllosticta capitalensis]